MDYLTKNIACKHIHFICKALQLGKMDDDKVPASNESTDPEPVVLNVAEPEVTNTNPAESDANSTSSDNKTSLDLKSTISFINGSEPLQTDLLNERIIHKLLNMVETVKSTTNADEKGLIHLD